MKKENIQIIAIVLFACLIVTTTLAIVFITKAPVATNIYNLFNQDDNNNNQNVSGNQVSVNPEVLLPSDYNNIVVVLEALSQRDLEPLVIKNYAQMLNMKIYGRNDLTAYQVYEQENLKNLNDGYITEGDYIITRTPNIFIITQIWHKGDSARALTVGEGINVTSYYGYNTVYLKSEGSLMVYWQMVAYIQSRPPL